MKTVVSGHVSGHRSAAFAPATGCDTARANVKQTAAICPDKSRPSVPVRRKDATASADQFSIRDHLPADESRGVKPSVRLRNRSCAC